MILYHSLSTSSAHTTMASLASSPIRYSFIRAIPAVFCRNPSKPFLSPSKVPLVRSNLINFTQRILNYRNYSAVTRASNTESPPGLYSSKKFDLTVENVDLVLEDVRPYLIADGGNVDVVSVDDGVISLKLQAEESGYECLHYSFSVCNYVLQRGLLGFVSFFGIKKANFRVGRAVLPKFFLEDVGLEGFEMVSRAKNKVAVTHMPHVMVESFLKEYLGIDAVVGRELKVVCGFFVGVMEEDKNQDGNAANDMDAYGISSFNQYLGHQHYMFSKCKDIYLTSEAERRSWHTLPRDKYTQPLIFHDGRLAFRPTPTASLSIFMWLPFGFFLAIFRAIVGLLLPFSMSIPILGCTGLVVKVQLPPPKSSTPSTSSPKSKGLLYVCNHRTLLDPLYLSFTLKKEPTAVTYSLSRMSELLSPIRTVRLTRDRHRDSKMMERMLSQGDLVVCPEGTTCREPYLLRFSPLFAELSDEIVPVAMDTHVSMFYGTTASGFKCLDPLFFLMNPCPSYNIVLLDKVSGLSRCRDQDQGGESRIDVANQIQRELGKTLGFECTNLTRKHKYLILAGNEGYVHSKKQR